MCAGHWGQPALSSDLKHNKQNQALQVHLKVLVVVRIDAETGDKAVCHELHVSVLAARPPPERFGRVEQHGLMGKKKHEQNQHEPVEVSYLSFFFSFISVWAHLT